MSDIIEQEPSSTAAATSPSATTPETAAAAPIVRPPHVKKPTRGRIFRRTGYTRAIIEGIVIFAAYRLLTMVPPNDWPNGAALIGIICLLLVLQFAPPVWAAKRVVSTRREKMSRRFWKMGPMLAVLCWLVDVVVTLGLGNKDPLIGPDGKGAVWQRLTESGAAHLSLGTFAVNELGWLAFLVIYFTIAVVCTRLANGGMLRFTMPAGNGRVTL
ncbi:MAG TPA: hypothetical protein VFU32_00620 [Ktedonobacterales bacterium]|nr:hypothetical protein [Ktedonobacterales bacterium]